ncbi:MAG: helix-turn-helix transcriptional regulator [Fibrobacteres bacterium]|nr:helix-turn-helix transcriptional regulator [Fibrobacterota bacterium]
MGVDGDFGFFQYTLSGAGMVRFGDKESKVEPGMGFVCRLDHAYRYWFDKKVSDHWEFIWIGMTGKTSAALLSGLQKDFGRLVALSDHSNTIRMMKEIHARSSRGEWKDAIQVSASVYRFLLQFIDDLRRGGRSDTRERIDQALDYIRENFASLIDFTTLAPRYGYSREHFARLFRKRTGKTPGRYLTDMRLAHAQTLLASSEMPLEQVATECGFGGANYLCRVFKERLNLSPRQYRHSREAGLMAGISKDCFESHK